MLEAGRQATMLYRLPLWKQSGRPLEEEERKLEAERAEREPQKRFEQAWIDRFSGMLQHFSGLVKSPTQKKASRLRRLRKRLYKL